MNIEKYPLSAPRKNKSDREQKTKDDRGAFENLKYFTLNEEEAKIIIETEKYPKFLSIEETAQKMREVLINSPHRPEFVAEMNGVLENLKRSAELLELSFKNQAEYNLVDKRWMRRPDYMKEALEKGRLAMELDVRMDKDGAFWVSHATGARASFTPPFIHEMTTEEMEKRGNRFTVEEALQIFSEYNDGKHKIILELKTLGSDEKNFPRIVENLKALIDKNGLKDAIAISSLSPGLLMSVHKVFPAAPLILNGGIVPGISYERPQEQQGITEKVMNYIKRKLIPADKKWRAFGIKLPWLGKLSEVLISASEETVIRPDGEGTQTGYALMRLPDDLTRAFLEQKQEGRELGGMVSLSAVTIFASVLDAVGASEKAKEMRQYYTEVVDRLGLGKMATTWGQGLSEIPFLGSTLFRKLEPKEQIRVFKEQLGKDTMVYTKGPERFAHELPDFIATYE
ncbi:MAG: hypothetical protein HZB99_00785 [Candidatus Harrisonbacteria bacterium]|nr:hypothetical protein [Candidatus Harrisonbacteria bacterium]